MSILFYYGRHDFPTSPNQYKSWKAWSARPYTRHFTRREQLGRTYGESCIPGDTFDGRKKALTNSVSTILLSNVVQLLSQSHPPIEA